MDGLPAQFNEATKRSIELIDRLWIKGNPIIAAFEVECTTAIYSGLLQRSDRLALQSNLETDLLLLASDECKGESEAGNPPFDSLTAGKAFGEGARFHRLWQANRRGGCHPQGEGRQVHQTGLF